MEPKKEVRLTSGSAVYKGEAIFAAMKMAGFNPSLRARLVRRARGEEVLLSQEDIRAAASAGLLDQVRPHVRILPSVQLVLRCMTQHLRNIGNELHFRDLKNPVAEDDELHGEFEEIMARAAARREND